MKLMNRIIIFIKEHSQSFLGDKSLSEIFRGMVWTLLSQVCSTVLILSVNIIIARKFGPAVLGIVSILNSFLMMATLFSVLGTGTSILRLIPEHIIQYSTDSAYAIYKKVLLLVGSISILIGYLFAFFSKDISITINSNPNLQIYIKMLACFILFASFAQINTQTIRALKLIRTFAIIQLLPQCSYLFLLMFFSFVVTLKESPYLALFGSHLITGLFSFIVVIITFKKLIKPTFPIKRVSLKSIISISAPMFINAMMVYVLSQSSVLMLGAFKNEAEVGFYGIAVKLATLCAFILTATNSMIAPKFSELFYKGEVDKLVYVAKKSAKFVFFLTMPILIFLVLFGKMIITVLFGPVFIAAYNPMMILLFGQLMNAISGSTGYFLTMTGNEKMFSFILVIAVVINVLGCYVLIPSFGNMGAAIASSGSVIIWNVLSLSFIKFKYGTSILYIPRIGKQRILDRPITE